MFILYQALLNPSYPSYLGQIHDLRIIIIALLHKRETGIEKYESGEGRASA